MTVSPLKYLSEKKLSELKESIVANRDRYQAGDFLDLEHDNGWAVETSTVQVDHDLLATLDGTARTAAADIDNSLILYQSLKGMTPALAREERIWARLTHIECLEYSRARWLSGNVGQELDKQVELHMFANRLIGIQRNNALSRLWWNMHVAKIADPSDPEGALRLILKRADIRLQFVDRVATASRPPLAQAILRGMRRDPWITDHDDNFSEFMIMVNRDGGGILFEALSDAEADAFMVNCASRAQAHMAK
jgi:hypothetical protein